MGRPVAQQDPDGPSPLDRRLDPAGERSDLPPREPLPLILDRGVVGSKVEHVGDPLAQRVIGHHRIRGSDLLGPPWSSSSALAIGFPSRV